MAAASQQPDADAARDRIQGAVVKRTSDGQPYELQPRDGGLLLSQRDPGVPDRSTYGQLAWELRNGHYYTLETGLVDALDALKGGDSR